MYQLKRSLWLSLVLALTQFACGRSSYKSYIYEKPSDGQAGSGDAQPILPEKGADEVPVAEVPNGKDGEELPVTDGKPQPCIPASALASALHLADICPPVKKPEPPKTPDTPVPPTENPSQN